MKKILAVFSGIKVDQLENFFDILVMLKLNEMTMFFQTNSIKTENING